MLIHKPKIVQAKIFLISTISLALIACGDDDNKLSDIIQNTKAENQFAKEMIREGCDPMVANAMAPFESDLGECDMPKFTESCGEENFDAGLNILPETREADAGGNPWLWACARRMPPQVSMVVICQDKLNLSQDVCSCAAKRTLSTETDADLIQWNIYGEALDQPSIDKHYKKWSQMGPDNRVMEVVALRNRYFETLDSCQ